MSPCAPKAAPAPPPPAPRPMATCAQWPAEQAVNVKVLPGCLPYNKVNCAARARHRPQLPTVASSRPALPRLAALQQVAGQDACVPYQVSVSTCCNLRRTVAPTVPNMQKPVAIPCDKLPHSICHNAFMSYAYRDTKYRIMHMKTTNWTGTLRNY